MFFGMFAKQGVALIAGILIAMAPIGWGYAGEPAAGEEKSGVASSAPVKKGPPASGLSQEELINLFLGAPMKVEKFSKPFAEATVVEPVKKVAVPVVAAEKPVETAKPEVAAPAAVETVVTPAPKPKKVVAKQKKAIKAANKIKKYRVVAASFSTRANAEDLVDELKVENYEPIVVQAKLPQGQFYRVIVGSYDSLSEARNKIAELRNFNLQPFCILEKY